MQIQIQYHKCEDDDDDDNDDSGSKCTYMTIYNDDMHTLFAYTHIYIIFFLRVFKKISYELYLHIPTYNIYGS